MNNDDEIDQTSQLPEQLKNRRILTVDDYPKSRTKLHRGSWCIQVSVPRPLRHLYGSPVVTKVAGKYEADVGRKKRSLTNEIYQEFDKRQADYNTKLESLKETYIKVFKEEYGATFVEREMKLFESVDTEAENTLQQMVSEFKTVLPRNSEHKYIETYQSMNSF